MESDICERPREKLIHHGAASLSLVELIQLVVGSGNSRVSGAKMARNIKNALGQEGLTYTALVAIDGVGVAKACQILAAFELAKRW